MKKITIAIGLLGLLLATPASAKCKCVCINGQVQPVCSSSLDLAPICAPRLCPMVPPAIKPLKMPTLPPLGTKKCRQVQVYNNYKGKYEWRTVCK
jgi:hypothetical protein